jgi:hypothetical protein
VIIRDRIRRWLGVLTVNDVAVVVNAISEVEKTERQSADTSLQSHIDGLSSSLNDSSRGLREVIDETRARVDRRRDAETAVALALNDRITALENWNGALNAHADHLNKVLEKARS